jgi:hypothetical protein
MYSKTQSKEQQSEEQKLDVTVSNVPNEFYW